MVIQTESMTSKRLTFQPVSLGTLDAFHTLVQDAHVRRYLLDDHVHPHEWSEDCIRASLSLFDRRGVGIWLAYETGTGELVGFCGFLEIPMVHPEPLVYALFRRFTGKGYGTEMARTAILTARRHPDFSTIVAGVDEVNAASVRVLTKLGFRRVSVHSGSLGNIFLLALETTDDTTFGTHALTPD